MKDLIIAIFVISLLASAKLFACVSSPMDITWGAYDYASGRWVNEKTTIWVLQCSGSSGGGEIHEEESPTSYGYPDNYAEFGSIDYSQLIFELTTGTFNNEITVVLPSINITTANVRTDLEKQEDLELCLTKALRDFGDCGVEHGENFIKRVDVKSCIKEEVTEKVEEKLSLSAMFGRGPVETNISKEEQEAFERKATTDCIKLYKEIYDIGIKNCENKRISQEAACKIDFLENK